VSARWQSAGPEERERIRKNRLALGDGEVPITEWNAFVHHLHRAAARVSKTRDLAVLDAAIALLRHIRDLEQQYDVRRQADHGFLEYAPTLEPLMRPPLGPGVLRRAIESRQQGRRVPWKVLALFNVTPESIAPRLVLGEGLAAQIRALVVKTARRMATEADACYDYQTVLNAWQAVTQACRPNRPQDLLSEREFSCLEWCVWRAMCLQKGFTYREGLESLRQRWSRNSALLTRDVATVRRKLASALASTDTA